jgi:hypothetical protein
VLEKLPPELRESGSLKELFLHGNEPLDLPELILGPTPEECRESKLPPTDPQDIFRWYFSEDEEERGQICLQIAMRAAELTQSRMAEEETRRKQREDAQRSLDEGLRRKEKPAPEEEKTGEEPPPVPPTPEAAPAAPGPAPAMPAMPTDAGPIADGGSSSHFLERQQGENGRKKPEPPRVTHNIKLDRPGKKALPERLSDKEKEAAKGGWGKKFLGGLLGKKKDGEEQEDVFK